MGIKNLFSKHKNEDFCTLRKRRTGLAVNLFLDDVGGWYNKNEDCYVVKCQNNTKDDAIYKHSISISIEDEPRILGDKVETSLTDKEIKDVLSYVSRNKDKLIALAKCDIDVFDYLKS